VTAPETPALAAAPARVPTILHRAEYVAWRAVLAALSVLPWRTVSALGAALGTLGYSPFRIRRRVVERQLAAAFPEQSMAALKRVARGAYANLGRLAVESARASNLPRATVLGLFHPPDGWEHLEHAAAEGKGVILVAGHLGNWELGLSYIAARGFKVSAVARQMGNPLFDAYVTRARARLGLTVIPDREAVRRIPRVLSEGHVVPMLADQGVKGLASIFVPFFGRAARTPKGPAVLALRLEAACVFMAVPLEADGKYRLHLEPVRITNTGDRNRDVAAIVTGYTAQLERWVRLYPEQYLWQHRRWKRRPDGTSEDL
jgi:KDO2-lipid IV(A) lauroyltransferase